jgi:hypothetical protein
VDTQELLLDADDAERAAQAAPQVPGRQEVGAVHLGVAAQAEERRVRGAVHRRRAPAELAPRAGAAHSSLISVRLFLLLPLLDRSPRGPRAPRATADGCVEPRMTMDW